MTKKRWTLLLLTLLLALALAGCKKFSPEGVWQQTEEGGGILQLMEQSETESEEEGEVKRAAVLLETDPLLLSRGTWEETDEGFLLLLGGERQVLLVRQEDDTLLREDTGERFAKSEEEAAALSMGEQNFVGPVWNYNDGSGWTLHFDIDGSWTFLDEDGAVMQRGGYIYENGALTLSGDINGEAKISEDLAQLTIEGVTTDFYDVTYIDPALIAVGIDAYLDYCWFDEEGWEFVLYEDLSWAIYSREGPQAYGDGVMQNGVVTLSGDVEGSAYLSEERDTLHFSNGDGMTHEFYQSTKR